MTKLAHKLRLCLLFLTLMGAPGIAAAQQAPPISRDFDQVYVDAGGTIQVNGTPMTLEQFKQELTRLRAVHGTVRLSSSRPMTAAESSVARATIGAGIPLEISMGTDSNNPTAEKPGGGASAQPDGPTEHKAMPRWGVSLDMPNNWLLEDFSPPAETQWNLYGPEEPNRDARATIVLEREPAKGRTLDRFVADTQTGRFAKATITASRSVKICNGTQDGWLSEIQQDEPAPSMSVVAVMAVKGKLAFLVFYSHRKDSPEDPQLRKDVEATCLL